MTPQSLDDEVLARCADDFETSHTIAGDIAQKLGRQISEEEVRAAVLSLAYNGLVQSYVFEASLGSYLPISAADAAKRETASFMISAEGRKLHEIEAS